jgi:hypothetical protein
MLGVSFNDKFSRTDNDFDRPAGTGPLRIAIQALRALAIMGLSLRDKDHSPIEAPDQRICEGP